MGKYNRSFRSCDYMISQIQLARLQPMCLCENHSGLGQSASSDKSFDVVWVWRLAREATVCLKTVLLAPLEVNCCCSRSGESFDWKDGTQSLSHWKRCFHFLLDWFRQFDLPTGSAGGTLLLHYMVSWLDWLEFSLWWLFSKQFPWWLSFHASI